MTHYLHEKIQIFTPILISIFYLENTTFWTIPTMSMLQYGTFVLYLYKLCKNMICAQLLANRTSHTSCAHWRAYERLFVSCEWDSFFPSPCSATPSTTPAAKKLVAAAANFIKSIFLQISYISNLSTFLKYVNSQK